MNLNIGCGECRYENLLGVDVRKTVAVDVQADIRKLPFKDNSIDNIAAEDVAEHFRRVEFPLVVKEWHRVLKSNGVLRIKTPYFSFLVQLFVSGKIPQVEAARKLYGNQDYPENTHYTCYDPSELGAVLKDAGFQLTHLFKTDNTNFILDGVKP